MNINNTKMMMEEELRKKNDNRAAQRKTYRGKRLPLKNKNELFDSCKSSRERQSLLKIAVEKEGFTSQVIEVQESTYLRSDALQIADKMIEVANYKKEYKRVNHDVMILNLSGIAGTAYIDYFLKEFWISRNLKNLIVVSPETGHYIDWEMRVVIEDFNPNDGNFIRMKTAFMSPSQEKKNEVTCIKWNGDNTCFEKLLNEVTDGMYEVLKTNGKNLTYTKLVKTGGYFAQGLAPSAEMKNYNLSSAAIVLSKNKRAFADGGGYFKSKPNFPIGIGAQMRNLGSDKWFGLCIDTKTISDLTKYYGPVIYVEKEIKEGRVTREQAQELIVKSFNKEDRGPWAEKTVVLGTEHGAPDVFMDQNIVKTPIDFMGCLPNSLKVLDLAGPISGDNIVLGSQMCFSLLLSKEGTDLMKELLLETIANAIVPGSEETIDDCKELCSLLKEIKQATPEDRTAIKIRSNDIVKNILDKYYNAKPRVLSFDEFEELKNYISGLLDNVNPYMARTMDQGTKKATEKAIANKMAGILSEFQPEVSGKFCRVLADASTELGLRLLDDNEICSPDLPLGEVVGIRSPKGGVKEQGLYMNISIAEMVQRVNESDLSNRDKRILKDIYKSLRKNSQVAFVPSSDEVKLLHSGMDHDFDGMTFISDRRVVKIFENHSPVIVKVTDEGNTTEDNKRYDFNMDYISILMESQFNNGNLPVGVVCNHNHAWVMMLSDLKLARKVLAFQFKGGGVITNYEGLRYEPISHNRLLVEIDAEKTDSILLELSELDYNKLDDNSMIKILEDINVIMNRYIQKTIDASKSGEVIEIPQELLINNIVQTASLTSIDFELYSKAPKNYLVTANGKLAIKLSSIKTSYAPKQIGKKKKFLFNDVYHQIRTDVARVAARILMELTKRNAKLDEETTLARDRVKYNEREFITFKGIFGDVNAFRRNISKDVSDEESADINADFRNTLAYLANTIRLSTSGMTPEERVLAAIDIATNKQNNVNAAASMFPSATLEWEYLILCSEHKKGMNFVGEPIHRVTLDLEDGEKIEIINKTFCGEGFINVPDGIYTVREHDGRFYATKSIKELVQPLLATDRKLIIRMSSGQDYNVIREDIKDGIINISTYKNSSIGKDCINGKHRIDLPAGRSNYADIIDGATAKVKKQVLSTTTTKRGLSIMQMFLCLETSNELNNTINNSNGTVALKPAVSNKVSLAKKARKAYESLSEEQKEIFPSDKLEKLEKLEASLGIKNIEEVGKVENLFDLI